jgi:acyl-CoA thioesterase FadM
MIGTYLRMVPVVFSARLQPRDNVSQLPQRVRWREIDINRHMNQARYADALERGRAHWLVRSGAWDRFRQAGINPVVANQRIEYRRELAPRRRYLIDTRAVALEDRLLHLEQLIVVGDRVHTRGDVRLIFVGPGGVQSHDVLQPLLDGLLAPSRPVADWRVTS